MANLRNLVANMTPKGRLMAGGSIAAIVLLAFFMMRVAGSPSYISPEIWHSEQFDHRVDVYSLQPVFHHVVRRPQCAACGDPALARVGGLPLTSVRAILRRISCGLYQGVRESCLARSGTGAGS